MKTYLLFYGKSQYFTTHAFDNNDYIEDFNTIIKDFDLLESKIFTVDGIDNNEILSKYNFITEKGKSYSLLKLYSFAQAYSGDRIAGSIYGVGLLSEGDISFCAQNMSILKAAKTNFAKLSLNGLKFNKSDFIEDAHKIWSALVNHKDGNLLNTIKQSNTIIISQNKSSRGYFVNNLYKDSEELNNQINKASRIYVSEDLDHLKRAHEKWGSNFEIFAKENGQYVPYQEPKPIPPPVTVVTPPIEEKPTEKVNKNSADEELKEVKIKLSDLENINLELQKIYDKFKIKAKRLIKLFKFSSIILLILSISFFFTTSYFKSKNKENEATIAKLKLQDNTSTIDNIMGSNNKRVTLYNLLQNIKDYEETLDTNKYHEAIIRDSKKLNIDVEKVLNKIDKEVDKKATEESGIEAEKAAKEKEAKEKEAKEKATREKATREKEAKEKAKKDQEKQEKKVQIKKENNNKTSLKDKKKKEQKNETVSDQAPKDKKEDKDKKPETVNNN